MIFPNVKSKLLGNKFWTYVDVKISVTRNLIFFYPCFLFFPKSWRMSRLGMSSTVTNMHIMYSFDRIIMCLLLPDTVAGWDFSTKQNRQCPHLQGVDILVGEDRL